MKRKIKSIFLNMLVRFTGRDWIESNFTHEWAISHDELMYLVAEETLEMYKDFDKFAPRGDDYWKAYRLNNPKDGWQHFFKIKIEQNLNLYEFDGMRIDDYVEKLMIDDLDAAYKKNSTEAREHWLKAEDKAECEKNELYKKGWDDPERNYYREMFDSAVAAQEKSNCRGFPELLDLKGGEMRVIWTRQNYQEEAAIRRFVRVSENFLGFLDPRLRVLWSRAKQYEEKFKRIDKTNQRVGPDEDTGRPYLRWSKSMEPNIAKEIPYEGRGWPGYNHENTPYKYSEAIDKRLAPNVIWNGQYFAEHPTKTRDDLFWKTDYGFLKQDRPPCDDPFIISKK